MNISYQIDKNIQLNRLLARQIRRKVGSIHAIPESMWPLLEAISRSYDHYEEDRVLLERSMDISSEELYEANVKLRSEADKQKQILDKLKTSLQKLSSLEAGNIKDTEKQKDEDILAVIDLIERQTERIHHFEIEQKELIGDLEEANQELKDFAYVVSHDLKAPLRGIGSLTDWLVADYYEILDDDGKMHLKLLKKRVRRMHNLIEGILQYSRIGRLKVKIVSVVLNDIVHDVVDSLNPSQHFQITIGSLPTIRNDETRMRQVFQNLISNAIKYNNKKQGIVHIDAQQINNSWVFSVADNGPGIDVRYHKKIFQIFQTLTRRDKVESTGIGLALVKKIVEDNKGKIWLESEKNVGTTFKFSLPI